jgi:hypothetical protein
LIAALVAQVVLGGALIVLAASGFRIFGGDRARSEPPAFDAGHAFAELRAQVALGPRPAGSAASRRLAERLRAQLPGGRFEAVPGGLRNVVGTLPGRLPAIAVAAHYDTKDLPGFVGANDGAAGTALVLDLARALARARPHDPAEVRFLLFDGEEAPRGTPEDRFGSFGLRGSKAYARAHARELRALVLLDFVGNRALAIPRERGSSRRLWAELRAAAARVGVLGAFPPAETAEIFDDHTPFARNRVPAIDLIDFDYRCFHRRCDDLSQISRKSLDQAGRATLELVRRLEAER